MEDNIVDSLFVFGCCNTQIALLRVIKLSALVDPLLVFKVLLNRTVYV